MAERHTAAGDTSHTGFSFSQFQHSSILGIRVSNPRGRENAMKTHLISALTFLMHMAAADWLAVEQPDLATQVEAAKPIATEDLCQPILSTRRDAVLYCPNPDGKTWDVILHYAPQYGHSHQAKRSWCL